MPFVVAEVKETFTVQSPAVIFGLFSEQVKTLAVASPKSSKLPAMYAGLAEVYARVPRIDDSSGGLPGDPLGF
jgi:hypothetical protein